MQAEGAAAMVEKPLWLHLAETVKAMSEEHPDHIGGGVEVLSPAPLFRGTSLIRTPPPVGPNSSPLPKDLR